MVAELTSPPVLLGIAGGIALTVMLLVVLAGRPNVPMPAVGAAFLVAAGLVTAIVWIGITGTPSGTTVLAGPPGGTQLPPPPTNGSPGPPPSGGPGGPACKPSGSSVEVVARNIAFEPTCLAAPAGQPFTLTLDNQDAGVPHNVQILSADPAADPSAQSLFSGDLVTGAATKAYDVPAFPAGTYFFRCDVHPQQMTGTFVSG